VAHANGATLLYCSAKEKALKDVVSCCVILLFCTIYYVVALIVSVSISQ
jgi:hypothetical protein